ncbi:hypothetical protein FE257_009489 [Aspergillus nanangensis]|uniref:Uncharacterized protein n=1 Tax=Aspergillus nanangensis TaxID=2582783 RepID=A0AAD4GSS7_ASPNN|nr:hypothetical protein FE257_009489 [Aspergillus nanangensis]
MTRNNQTAARTVIRRLFRRREVHLISEDELDEESANLLQDIARSYLGMGVWTKNTLWELTSLPLLTMHSIQL